MLLNVLVKEKYQIFLFQEPIASYKAAFIQKSSFAALRQAIKLRGIFIKVFA